VLPPVRIEVESSGIRHIGPRVIRNDGDVIAYLALIRIAFKRIKRIAYSDVSRPGDAGVGAERIE
jgi:hypothetical protein